MFRRVVCCIPILVALALGSACSANDTVAEQGSPGVVVPPTMAPGAASELPLSTDDSAETAVDESSPEQPLSPLAELVKPVGDLRRDLDAALPETPASPVGISIGTLGVSDARIQQVGVETNGEMEIPGASEVGWYRWSSSPGEEGSAVLAAHIAFDGRDGVFRNLARLSVGDRFFIDYDDGSSREFEVTERAQYNKEELPFDRVFAKEGPPSVVLISCGGDFNRGLSSYEDNVVAFANPV